MSDATDRWVVRRCAEADLDEVSAMAAELVRFHHTLDPERYVFSGNVREGYRRWLHGELGKASRVSFFVLARGAEIGGYAYGRLEERDWMKLLDAHGALHDVWVRDDLRGGGHAERLVLACVEELERLGAPRVVLNTAWANERGRRFFEKLGFRPTMLEMSRG